MPLYLSSRSPLPLFSIVTRAPILDLLSLFLNTSTPPYFQLVHSYRELGSLGHQLLHLGCEHYIGKEQAAELVVVAKVASVLGLDAGTK